VQNFEHLEERQTEPSQRRAHLASFHLALFPFEPHVDAIGSRCGVGAPPLQAHASLHLLQFLLQPTFLQFLMHHLLVPVMGPHFSGIGSVVGCSAGVTTELPMQEHASLQPFALHFLLLHIARFFLLHCFLHKVVGPHVAAVGSGVGGGVGVTTELPMQEHASLQPFALHFLCCTSLGSSCCIASCTK